MPPPIRAVGSNPQQNDHAYPHDVPSTPRTHIKTLREVQGAPSAKRTRGMEGDGQYNKNSLPQASANTLGLPAFREAAQNVLRTSAFTGAGYATLRIADYGSSQGRNSVAVIKTALAEIPTTIPVGVLHCDLPTNDFNSLIRVINDENEGYVKSASHDLYTSVRGKSFYEKVCPDRSIHLAWSAIATHWLSDIPRVPLNNPFVHKATNSERAAWVRQARKDWALFVDQRARELTPGGHFVQVGISRDTHSNTNGSEGVMAIMTDALKEMLSPEHYATVRVPVYARTKEEWLEPFTTTPGVWTVRELSGHYAHDPLWAAFQEDGDLDKYIDAVTGVIRAAVFVSLVHEGPTIDIDHLTELFKNRLRENPEKGRISWYVTVLHVERR